MKLSVLLSLIVLAVAPSFARDTLSYFAPESASSFYRDRGILAQAARFDLPAPAYVRRLTIWLAGKTTGSATLTLYGNEGAFAAPLLGQPLSNPITVRKDRPGVQKVEVLLPPNVFIDRPQFFVVLTDVSDGIHWLSDRREKRPRCESGTDQWLYQAIKGSDGIWRAGKYGYAIEAIVDYPEEIPPTYLADITADAGFPDDLLSPFTKGGPSRSGEDGSGRGGSIAWADIDNDTRPDVMVANRLFINKGDDRFEEATDRLGTTEHARAHHFIDIENDGDPDILLLGLPDSTSALLENDGDGYFSRRDVVRRGGQRITNPTTVSFADVDRDGYLDAFVGDGRHDSGDIVRGFVLRNDGGTSFVPQALRRIDIDPTGSTNADIISAQWLDHDADGDPDLYLTGRSAAESQLLVNDGAGNLAPNDFNTPSATDGSSLLLPDLQVGGQSGGVAGQSGGGTHSPSDLADVNSDGNPDLLQPTTFRASDLIPSLGGVSAEGGRGGSQAPVLMLADRELPYQGFSGGGTWADADNDGRLDALVTSACDCRFASLYVQDQSGHFQDQSFEYGLFRLPAGNDAVWVDFNNDGKLDVATFVGGRFRLLKNTGDFSANFIAADLSGSRASSAAVGGTVTVHYGDKKQTRPVVSGRGSLMQGPLRVHFGLGDVSSVDSLVVEWNDTERRTLIEPALNKVHSPFNTEQSETGTGTTIAFDAWPNPFRTALNFKYTVPEKAHVRLEIHRLDGELLAVIVDEEQAAGDHSAEWRALDASGSLLPAGTYIYRVRIGSQVLTGRAVLAK